MLHTTAQHCHTEYETRVSWPIF